MFLFNKISDFIALLNKERKLIDIIFSTQKKAVRYDDLLNFDYEAHRIEELIEKNILIKSGRDNIELSSSLRDFLDKFTDNYKEINTEYTEWIIRDIRENFDYYEKENKYEEKQIYLNKIKRNLRDIGQDILQNINNIRDNVENVIATEQNYKLKKIKLENYDKRRKKINVLMNDITELLKKDNWKFFIKTSGDNDLLQIVANLHKKLSVAHKNWIDITQKIIVYLNQVKLQTELTKKIIKLKELKNELILRTTSNFETIIQNETSLFFQQDLRFSTKPSLAFLETENGIELIENINSKKKRKLLNIKSDETPIENEFFNENTEEKQRINMEKIKLSFNSQSENLFDFLIDYKYNMNMPINKRITLYCQFASQYSDDINITEKYNIYNNTNNEEFNTIEYAVILPK